MAGSRFATRPESVLEDPGARAVATLYAQSFLSAAQANQAVSAEEELESFVREVLGKFPEFREILLSDFAGRDEKLQIINRSIAPQCSEFFANFLRVLVRHGRTELLPVILEVVIRLRETAAGKQRVRVRSPRPLTSNARNQISASLKARLGFEPILEESIDPQLIGGVVLQIGDTVFDSSLRSRLKTLQGRLVEKAFNEIQSRRDRFSHPEGD
ncbi:MAG: F-type ATPase subunit delta [Planctomycetota bacterium]|jgi:F-type H+-transporting ATPase subunit delta